MRAADINPSFREALAVHEAFRKLGYSPEQIFVTLTSDSRLFVILKHLGREFAVFCGELAMSEPDFYAAWPTLVTAVNGGAVAEEELNNLYRDSYVYRERLGFLAALKAKGIAIPAGMQ